MSVIPVVLFFQLQGFEDSVKNAVTTGFDDATGELYKQVMIKGAWLAEKDLPGNKSDKPGKL